MKKHILYGFPGGFPLTQDALNFMQQNTETLNDIAEAVSLLHGSRYIIVKGCVPDEQDPEALLPGVVVFDGEFLPFMGGRIREWVKVTEQKQSVVFMNETVREVYISRYMEFTDEEEEGAVAWSEFKAIKQKADIDGYYPDMKVGDSDKLGGRFWSDYFTVDDVDKLDPWRVNQLKIFGSKFTYDNPKYLLADGSIVSKQDYPDLLGDDYFPVTSSNSTVSLAVPTIGRGVHYDKAGYKYLILGANEIMVYSQDGKNWTAEYIAKTSGKLGYGSMYATFLIKANTRWLVGPSVWYSDNERTTWTKMSLPSGVSGATKMLFGNDILCMLPTGTTSALWYSHDLGGTWTKCQYLEGLSYESVIYANGRFYIGTTTGVIYMTTDFVSFDFIQLPHFSSITNIAYLNGTLFAQSVQGVCVSRDGGYTWTMYDLASMPLGTYVYDAGFWMVEGTLNGVSGIFYSDDLSAWQTLPVSIGSLLDIESDGSILGIARASTYVMTTYETMLGRMKVPNVTLSNAKVYIKALK